MGMAVSDGDLPPLTSQELEDMHMALKRFLPAARSTGRREQGLAYWESSSSSSSGCFGIGSLLCLGTAEEAATAYDGMAKLDFPEQLALSAMCLRGFHSASRNGSRIHRIHGAQGIIAHPAKVNVTILDSGSSEHCTGDKSLLSDYTEEEKGPDLYGAGNEPLEVYGSGSIRNARFHIKDVLYIPIINREDYTLTILSVSKLRKDGYSINFDEEGGCTVMDKRSRVWSWSWSWTKWFWSHKIVGKGREVHGDYHMDYLRTRAHASTSSEGADVSQSHGVTARRRPDI